MEFDWYPPASGAHGPDGGPPLWDGSDTWPISSTGLADGISIDNPKFRNIHAYVTGHVLVASLPASFFTLGGSGISGVSCAEMGGLTVNGTASAPVLPPPPPIPPLTLRPLGHGAALPE